MGASQSLNSDSTSSQGYKKELRYYPNFNSQPVRNQDFKVVEQKHLDNILKGGFSDLFEDEDVEYVWIYCCPLSNEEDAKIGTTSFGTVAAVAGVLSLVPVVSK